MAIRRMRPGVAIIPTEGNCGPPRFAVRTAHEHDQNDAFNARQDWFRQYASEIKQIEDNAVAKAMKKVEEEKQKAAEEKSSYLSTILFFGMILLVLSPFVSAVEKGIFKAITGW